MPQAKVSFRIVAILLCATANTLLAAVPTVKATVLRENVTGPDWPRPLSAVATDDGFLVAAAHYVFIVDPDLRQKSTPRNDDCTVAKNDDGVLTACADEKTLLVRLRDSSGAFLREVRYPTVSILYGPPSVASDGTNWLIVTERFASLDFTLLGADLNIIASRREPIVTDRTPSSPAAAWSGLGYVVVWTEWLPCVTSSCPVRGDIRTALLDSTLTTFVRANPTIEGRTTGEAPGIACSEINCAVIWSGVLRSLSGTYAQLLDRQGVIVGTPVYLSEEIESVPVVTRDEKAFIFSWQERTAGSKFDLWVVRLDQRGGWTQSEVEKQAVKVLSAPMPVGAKRQNTVAPAESGARPLLVVYVRANEALTASDLVAQLVDDLSARLPEAPANLRISNAGSGPILEWDDRSLYEREFVIEYRAAGSAEWLRLGTAPADATSFSLSALPRDRTYFFRVRAATTSVASAASNEVRLDPPLRRRPVRH
jgi:hypothetical protein